MALGKFIGNTTKHTGKPVTREDRDAQAAEHFRTSRTAFPPNAAHNPEEKLFWDQMNTQFARIYDATSSQVVPLLGNTEQDLKQSIVKTAAMASLWKSVRAAGRLYYAEQLKQATDKALNAVLITPEDAKALTQTFAVQAFDPKSFFLRSLDSSRSALSTHDVDYDFLPQGLVKLNSIKTTEDILAGAKLTPSAKMLAERVFDEAKPILEKYDHAVNTLGGEEARSQWAAKTKRQYPHNAQYAEDWMLNFSNSGKFFHQKPAFKSETDQEVFSRLLAKSIGQLLLNTSPPFLAESIIQAASDSIAGRVGQHDEKIKRKTSHAEQERQRNLEQMAARRAKANAGNGALTDGAREHAQRAQDRLVQVQALLDGELLRRAEEKRLAYEEFMASHRPYVLEDGAQRVVQAMQTLTSGDGYKAPNAQVLLDAVTKASALLDIRDESQKETGRLLLSGESLHSAGKVLSVADSMKNIVNPGTASLKERARHLRLQVHTSDEVKQIVDTMLADNEMALLVALHMRGEEPTARYATALADMKRKQKEVTAIKNRVGKFTDEEFSQILADSSFGADPNVKLLKKLNGELSGISTAFERAKEALVTEVHQVFDGVPPRKIARSESGSMTATKTAVEARVPESWFKLLGDDYHLEESARGDKYVAVHSNQHPDLSVQLKANTPEADFKQALGTLANEVTARVVNRKIRKGLHKEAGFSVITEGSSTLFRHPEYGITVPLEGSELEKTFALTSAKDRYESKKFEQESLLTTLMMAGIGVEQSNTSTGRAYTLTSPDKIRVTVAPRGYFSADDFSIAQAMLSRSTGQDLPEAAAIHEPTTNESRIWKPGKGEHVLVFDANVIHNLATSRGGNQGKSWLDLVKETARLPDVTVVIPEVVLFELTGKIPVKSSNGGARHYKEADHSFAYEDGEKFATAKYVNSLLQDAAFGQVEGNGEVRVTGGRGKVMVVSTPEDAAVFKMIHDKVLSAPREGRSDKLHEHVYRRGEGEKAIARFVAALPDTNHVVLTDDTVSFKKTEMAVNKTTSGRPVLYAGTGAYIDSEINASRERYRELTRSLRNPGALSVHTVYDDITAGGRGLGKDGLMVMQYCTREKDPETGESTTIMQVIRNAVAKSLNGHAGGNGVVNGAGWATESLKKPISPADIAARERGAEEWKRG